MADLDDFGDVLVRRVALAVPVFLDGQKVAVSSVVESSHVLDRVLFTHLLPVQLYQGSVLGFGVVGGILESVGAGSQLPTADRRDEVPLVKIATVGRGHVQHVGHFRVGRPRSYERHSGRFWGVRGQVIGPGAVVGGHR